MAKSAAPSPINTPGTHIPNQAEILHDQPARTLLLQQETITIDDKTIYDALIERQKGQKAT